VSGCNRVGRRSGGEIGVFEIGRPTEFERGTRCVALTPERPSG